MSKNVGLPADGQEKTGGATGANVKIVRITAPSNIKIGPVEANGAALPPSGETFVHRVAPMTPTISGSTKSSAAPVAAVPATPIASPPVAIVAENTPNEAAVPDAVAIEAPQANAQKSGATPKLVGLAVGLCAIIGIMLLLEATRSDGEDVASLPDATSPTTSSDIVAALKPVPTPEVAQSVVNPEPVEIAKPEPKPETIAEMPPVVAEVARPVVAETESVPEIAQAPVVVDPAPKPTPAKVIAAAPKSTPEPAPVAAAPVVEEITPVIAAQPRDENADLMAQITSGTLAALRGKPTKPLDSPAARNILQRVRDALAQGQSRFEIEKMLNTGMTTGAFVVPPQFIRGDGRVNTTAIFSEVLEN